MKLNKPEISYIVCTYNGARTIRKCLDSILDQAINGANFSVEIVVVSNGIQDSTCEIIKSFIDENRDVISILHLDIERPGKSRALMTAFNNANGRFISVIDDDNYISSKWHSSVIAQCDRLGFGGILGTSSALPAELGGLVPKALVPFLPSFAVGDQQAIKLHSSNKLAWGAGMVFKKEIWTKLKKAGFEFALTGRVGDILVAGEDIEFCYASNLFGVKVELTDDIQLIHDIGINRLSQSYLDRLFVSDGMAQTILILYGKSLELNMYSRSALYSLQVQALIKNTIKYLFFSLSSGPISRQKCLMAKGFLIGFFNMSRNRRVAISNIERIFKLKENE